MYLFIFKKYFNHAVKRGFDVGELQKVISILGKDFESAGARITPDGPIESISYKTVTMTIADYSEGYYILSFKNGILVEWFKEKTPINNNTAN